MDNDFVKYYRNRNNTGQDSIPLFPGEYQESIYPQTNAHYYFGTK